MPIKLPLTFKQQIGAGFAITIVLTLLIGVASFFTLRLVIKTKDIVTLDYAQDVIEAENAHSLIESMVASSRAALFTGDQKFVERMAATRTKVDSKIQLLHQLASSPKGKLLVEQLEKTTNEYNLMIDQDVAMKKPPGLHSSSFFRFFEIQVQDRRDQLEHDISTFINYKQQLLAQGKEASGKATRHATTLLILISIAAVLLASAVAFVLTQALAKLYRDSQARIRSRENIVAIVSHDLKNPLSAIMLTAKLLARKDSVKLDLDAQKLVQRVEQSAQRMNHLISDLLNLARLEAGQFPIERTICKTMDILEEALVTLEPIANSKSIRIKSEVPDTNSSIFCDKERLLQVFTNLIGNAIKFTPAEGTITIRAASNDANAQLSISDTGPGIPKDQLPYIFERYKQTKAEDRKSGAGLGLYIAKEIVEAHGGKIWAENNPEVGATFVFNLSSKEQESTDPNRRRHTAS